MQIAFLNAEKQRITDVDVIIFSMGRGVDAKAII